jgi:hypothetical protein
MVLLTGHPGQGGARSLRCSDQFGFGGFFWVLLGFLGGFVGFFLGVCFGFFFVQFFFLFFLFQ